jgi:hypothetical protein
MLSVYDIDTLDEKKQQFKSHKQLRNITFRRILGLEDGGNCKKADDTATGLIQLRDRGVFEFDVAAGASTDGRPDHTTVVGTKRRLLVPAPEGEVVDLT